MISMMGNCIAWTKKKREPRRAVTLVILGIDNAGKTVATKGFQGEPVEDVAPTVGFDVAEFKFQKFDITLYDLGGRKNFRDVWHNYLADVHGVIYVIDSSNHERIEESRLALKNLIEHPCIGGKPILILANKQDLDNALDELDICDRLNLEELVNQNKCPTRVELCSALSGTGKKMDKPIKEGMLWILERISGDFESLGERVNKEKEAQRQREAEERKLKRERVRKIKEEREKKEAEERAMRGEQDEEENEETDLGGDPFKRLDIAELEKKDAALKAKKKQQKLKEQQKNKDDDLEVENSERTNGLNANKNQHKTDDVNEDSQPKQSVEDLLFGTSNTKSSDSMEMSLPARKSILSLDGSEPDQDVGKKKKRTKKKAKRNQTAPGDDDGVAPKAYPDALAPLTGWQTPPGQRSLIERPVSRSPRLAPIAEPRNTTFGNNWKDELPELPPIRRIGPNTDADDVVT